MLADEHTHAPLKRTAWFRFYEELNDFLPEELRKKSFPYEFTGTPSVKNSIEAIGVPQAEVDLVIVNGESVGFDHRLHGGERISVYPVFESLDISPLVHLRAKPLRHTKFIADVNLGSLARKLRLLGFDTYFRNDLEDDEIVRISLNEKRIILTRDIGILKHNVVTHAYWLRSDDPPTQLKEVVRRFQLEKSLMPFSRCSVCNARLKPVDLEQAKAYIPENTLKHFNEFYTCPSCGKYYWKGSHYEKILEWVKEIEEQG
ncbi:MAG: Mut7-C ubiquitin/RNAse domain-containing protein [Bacteroidales bacterium]|nr:Mut7-C ubiquitin/RNAse domain-containing protein [Bacteroidales bacterium]MCF8345084.1 Mut7-C ubiquitin/RNAse domain-containing protein [Bacteroidales bacterium]MCF8351244.1 Mut7-C ubiquitin/RNAse domain-containing protein [Bacteroidales bacterium]MCF8377605.1 Mut7-C ubiquitin/RNAse domain-containing protein [Bacteroidales bacterium]MCF8401894.1 Mut7-C ubiquitin/RNAse domain-containing protein [Bacteroidales bacterium]